VKISAALITRDAGADLERCLASLDFVDEIVVLDQDSRDGTLAICERHGARVEREDTWRGFGPMKAAAVALTRHRWVLSIDADEEVTPELRAAILALPDEPECPAYAVNRLSRFLGRWIHHCGWHPEWVVRLFDKERAGFNDRPVHEAVEVQGKPGRLDGLLHHYTYESVEQYVAKLNRYTTLAAEAAVAEGRRASLPSAALRSLTTFWRMWLLKAGFRDGWHGLALCLCSSFYVLIKYLKIWRAGRS
jgi:glycosyltransferase involved in cell wall biosynthesis